MHYVWELVMHRVFDTVVVSVELIISCYTLCRHGKESDSSEYMASVLVWQE